MNHPNQNRKNTNRFHEALHEGDTSNKTWGCRHTNPEICKNHSLFMKCAFVREDNICLIPPLTWRRQFEKLSKNMNKG